MADVVAESRDSGLQTPVQFLKGVGPKQAPLLAKLGLNTVGDVLFFLPRRYEDRTNLPPIRNVRAGDFVTVKGKVIGSESKRVSGGRVIFKATIHDGTGSISLMWFNQPWVAKKLSGYDGEVVAYGQVKESGWAFEIQSPEYETIDADEDASEFAKIVPIYPLSEGVRQALVRKAVSSAVERYLDSVEEPLPATVLRKFELQPIQWCIRQIHAPESEENRLAARKRLVFEEFLALQLMLEQQRAQTQSESGISFPISSLGSASLQSSHNIFGELSESVPLEAQVRKLFPFELTGAQNRVIHEIWADMERPYPMNRLLQGDVGSGKTAVAAAAILAAVRCGFQAVLMAPTEILAEQHYANLRKIFDPAGIDSALFLGKQSKSERAKSVQAVSTGQAHFAVGTHALIQEHVEFQKLGLVIIDEQHRFGVMQRAALRQKGYGNPDVLVMTATPIPRTLTMALYGDLDISILDELPPGRTPIKTYWKSREKRDSVYDSIRNLVETEQVQAYVVCPMVSESEKLQAQAAEDLHYQLTQSILPDCRIGLLHGQLKSKEKDAVMSEFRDGKLDVLVSTTVIEVGVDVPNASVMVIEDANRFGLAQLHQLRGRVGRGSKKSYCVLLSDAKSAEAEDRMNIMVSTTDGFKIAEEDLRIRGPGEVMGTKQSGNLDFKIADLVQDSALLEISRQAAQKLIAADPELKWPEHAGLLRLVRSKRSAQAVVAIS